MKLPFDGGDEHTALPVGLKTPLYKALYFQVIVG
jgi:hypothetical protein